MKTLLLGGPDNGKVIDTDRNQFGHGMYTETIEKSTNKQLSMVGYNYTQLSCWSVKHPLKKKGSMKVFVFTGEKVKEPTKEQLKVAFSAIPPEANVYCWLHPEKTVKDYAA